MRGYRQSQVLISCAELRVFEMLQSGPQDAATLAASKGAHAGALARLLDAATAFGLLEKQDGRYANSSIAATCLVPAGPCYLGNLIRREAAFYRRWSRLTDAVLSGERPQENRQVEQESNWVRGFELALFDVARISGPQIAEALAPFVPAADGRAVQVIDIGGGHGGYSVSLARRYSGLEATVFDLPPVMEITHEVIAASGLGERVKAQPGDFKTDPFGSEFDLALLFSVLVSETATDAIALLRKVAAALKPGGYVAIRGFYLNAERSGPPDATLFDLHMLLSTGAGGAHTVDELGRWLAQGGFEPPVTVEIPAELSSLLVARKHSP